AAFQALHDAYQHALRIAPQWADDDQNDATDDSVAVLADATVAPLPPEPEPEPELEPIAAPIVAPAVPPLAPAPLPHAPHQPVELTGLASLAAAESAPSAPPAPPPSAWEEGMALWQKFLADSDADADAARVLAKLQADGTFDSLAVNEVFELRALEHCARADCRPALRTALVQHFRWEDEHAHLERSNAAAVNETLGRYHAHQSLLILRERAAGSEPLQALLASSAPRRSMKTRNASFMKELRNHLGEIRHRYPELLHYELNPDVVAWWQQQADQRRYYVSTAVWSLVLAWLLYVGVQFALHEYGMLATIGSAQRDKQNAVSFGLCALLSFGLLAWNALRTPPEGVSAVQAWRDRCLPYLFYYLQPGKNRQLAWLAQVLACLLLMLIPDPLPLLQWAIQLVLGICALNGLFAPPHALSNRNYVFVIVATLVFAHWLSDDLYPQHHYLASMLAAICIASLALRGSAALRAELGVTAAALKLARGAWLAGGALLFAGIASAVLPLVLAQLLAIAACFGGLLLTRVSAAPQFFVPLALLTAFALSNKTLLHFQLQPQATLLQWGLFVVGLFMVVSLAKSFRPVEHFS
ncbi:MAG: hypothetical protein ABW202_08300, partial [Duganella sp.]